MHSSSPLARQQRVTSNQVQGYSESEVETFAAALELETDVAALELEINVTALELEMDVAALEL
jgi:hypothetical protein